MSRAIQQHTEELRRERLASRSQANHPKYGGDPMKRGERFNKETTNMTSVFSEMDSFFKTARMQSSNAGYQGGWTVSKRVPSKPYQPNLRDTYPRNQYTMMPEYNGPKYYTGHFLKYDYKDQPPKPAEVDTSRPVVFKTQTIERVQTKKKYGHNLKGDSSVPLHLCNDVSSLLYQRSLQPDARERAQLESRTSSELSELRSTVSRYPFALHQNVKNDASVLNPLNYNAKTQTWVDTSYPTRNRHRKRQDTASSFWVTDRTVDLDDKELRSGRIRSAPEWYSEFFPRQRVADALKFMGKPKTMNQTARTSDFVIDFNGKR
ncbi:hypothetical protein DPMN_025850 [Dreissena polymorpha]|uniref:Uncharacterized protein n=1 Tax=Dreissena polymorpha TaxID=45954 RepID=A0A9D4RE07_DREPO|nr:hypothetical protein DPMN_025850 [Dreissena polymorpha]